MNTNRVFSAVAAAVLGTGLALTVAGAPANAAPATGPSPVTACQGIGGTFGEVGGTWYCQYSATYGNDPQVLTDWCFNQDFSSTDHRRRHPDPEHQLRLLLLTRASRTGTVVSAVRRRRRRTTSTCRRHQGHVAAPRWSSATPRVPPE